MCSAILTVVDDNKVDPLLDTLHKMDLQTEQLGLRAFVWNIERTIYVRTVNKYRKGESINNVDSPFFFSCFSLSLQPENSGTDELWSGTMSLPSAPMRRWLGTG